MLNNSVKRGCISRGTWKFLPAAFLVGFLTGCSTIEPLVQDFNIVSVNDEVLMGQEMQKQVEKEKQIVTDPALDGLVNRIGQKLLQGLPSRNLLYRFYVVKDDTPNAFTIPGGAIYVHTGLIKFADNESQIAGVMSHELGHAYLRHPARSISREYGLDYISSILLNRGSAPAKTSPNIIGQLLGSTFLTRYSREDEFQADDYGFYLLTKAGYQPDGLLRFFKKLQSIETGSGPSFLSSHPPTPERIARLQARISNMNIQTVPAAAKGLY